VLTTDQKGATAELAIAHVAASHGVGGFKPLTDGECCDLIFNVRTRFSPFSASGRHASATC